MLCALGVFIFHAIVNEEMRKLSRSWRLGVRAGVNIHE